MSDNNRKKLADMTVADALRKIEAGGEESLTLLRMIEGNTKPATVGRAVKSAIPGQQFVRAESKPRDSIGRFTSSKTATEKTGKSSAESQGKTLTQILKGGAANIWKEKKGDVKDIAGRAALGPLWDVGKQIKEAFQSAHEKSGEGTVGELRAWGTSKFGKKTSSKSGSDNGNGGSSFADMVSRKRSLKDSLKRGPGGKISMKPSAVGGGGGGGLLGRAGGAVSGVAKFIGPLLSGISLPLVAAAGAAAFGVQQFAKALITGESDVNNWFKKITGLDAGKETQADKDKAAKNDQSRLDELNKQRAAQGLSAVDSSGRYKTEGNVVFANGNTTTTRNADGSLTEQKGTRAARNNNSGNMEYGPAAKALGATGSDGRFAVFPDKATGDKAKEKMFFEGKNYKDKTLSEATARWAPSNENDTAKYTAVLKSAAGGEDKKMSEYTPEQRKSIMAAMEKHEGNKLTSSRVIPASEADSYLASKAKAGTAVASTAPVTTAPDAAGTSPSSPAKTATAQGTVAPGATKKKGKSSSTAIAATSPTEQSSSGQKASAAGPGATEAATSEEPKAETAPKEQTAIAEAPPAQQSPSSTPSSPATQPSQAQPAVVAASAPAAAPLPEKQYGAGDLQAERNSVGAQFDSKRRKLASQFQSGSLSEADYVSQVKEAQAESEKKKTSIAELQKKASSGQMVSQSELDIATGKAPQPATATGMIMAEEGKAVAVAQGQPEYKRPPEPKPIQPEPPKIQGMDQLVAATQQQNQTQQANQQGGSDKDRVGVVPNIPTEFSDTQLTLMAYDRI